MRVITLERYRFYSDGAIYFVTFTVVDWLPVFVSQAACRIIADSLNYCHDRKGLRTNAYVIMPTHMHAVLFSQDFRAKSLKDALTDFRKFTGRQLSDFCGTHMPACFANVLRETAPADRDRRFWQPGLHPVQVQNEAFWKAKVDYLHENPCRKGLVRRQDHWRYSSAAHALSDGQAANDVILSAIEW
jgi:putative transposase